MEFEQYYTDLLEMLNSSCKKIAQGEYDQSDVDKIFERQRPNDIQVFFPSWPNLSV